ncbi:MAG: hypothetical protein ACOVLC_12075 [Flavobacterium sp.]
MNKNKIENYLNENIETFPLSFIELNYNDKYRNGSEVNKLKVFKSKKYLSDNFPSFKFYKKISRL